MGPFLDMVEAEGNQLFGEAAIGENGNDTEIAGDTNYKTVDEEYHVNKLVIERLKERILSGKKNTRNVLCDELKS
eukprot:7487287-Ditylum_brightwellii.AAC.1